MKRRQSWLIAVAVAAVSTSCNAVAQTGTVITNVSLVDGTFERPPSATPSVNVASFAGHGTIRSAVMGEDFKRPATPAEIARMGELLHEEMKAGALGLSSGLEYDPGIYSNDRWTSTRLRRLPSCARPLRPRAEGAEP